MPSKASLISLGSGAAVLNWAASNLDVDSLMVQYRLLADGQKQARLCLKSNPEDIFYGTGPSKLDALAEAVSEKFPLPTYPNP